MAKKASSWANIGLAACRRTWGPVGWSGFAMASSGVDLTGFGLNPTSIPPGVIVKTLPKALRTQALTASTSSFGLILWVGFGMFGSVGLLG